MTPADAMILCAAGSGLAVFFILHFVLGRLPSSVGLYRLLMNNIGWGAFVTFMVVVQGYYALDVPLTDWTAIGIAALSQTVYILCVFVYILCIFGPYETSIRMRLIRELAAAPEGLTIEEILARYNAGIIVENRLERLSRSRDVIQKDGRYQLVASRNMFFFLDAGANLLKRLIGK